MTVLGEEELLGVYYAIYIKYNEEAQGIPNTIGNYFEASRIFRI